MLTWCSCEFKTFHGVACKYIFRMNHESGHRGLFFLAHIEFKVKGFLRLHSYSQYLWLTAVFTKDDVLDFWVHSS